MTEKKIFLNYRLLSYKKTITPSKYNNKIKYSLSFISLISPFISNNFFFIKNLQTYHNQKKIYLKQSFIIITWLYYLSFINIKLKKNKQIKIFTSPSKKLIFTNTKAPIAHKNWSKEQYKFNFYNFKISITGNIKTNKIKNRTTNKQIDNINYAMLFFLITKFYFPTFETNIFFLKNHKTLLNYADNFFFNYYRFIKYR